MRSPSACLIAVLACLVGLLAACGYSSSPAQGPGEPASSSSRPSAGTTTPIPAPVPWQLRDPLPGMPPVIGGDVYSQTRRGMLSPVLAKQRPLLFVPDSRGSSVTVIDQRTRKIVKVIASGSLSQHVVPSYDLSKLIVNASASTELVERTLQIGCGPLALATGHRVTHDRDGEQPTLGPHHVSVRARAVARIHRIG